MTTIMKTFRVIKDPFRQEKQVIACTRSKAMNNCLFIWLFQNRLIKHTKTTNVYCQSKLYN